MKTQKKDLINYRKNINGYVSYATFMMFMAVYSNCFV